MLQINAVDHQNTCTVYLGLLQRYAKIQIRFRVFPMEFCSSYLMVFDHLVIPQRFHNPIDTLSNFQLCPSTSKPPKLALYWAESSAGSPCRRWRMHGGKRSCNRPRTRSQPGSPGPSPPPLCWGWASEATSRRIFRKPRLEFVLTTPLVNGWITNEIGITNHFLAIVWSDRNTRDDFFG